MAGIDTYTVDSTINDADKVIGTDSANSDVTRNFRFDDISDYVRNNVELADITDVTSTELNILDGATITTDELNTLDGVTGTIVTDGGLGINGTPTDGQVIQWDNANTRLNWVDPDAFDGTYSGDVTFTSTANNEELSFVRGNTSLAISSDNSRILMEFSNNGANSDDSLGIIDFDHGTLHRGRIRAQRNGGDYLLRFGVGTSADDANNFIIESSGVRIGGTSNNELTNDDIGRLNDLPDLPTGDGTTQKKILQTTGSSGSETYSWVDESEAGGGIAEGDATVTPTGQWTWQNSGNIFPTFENTTIARLDLIKTGSLADGNTVAEIEFGHDTDDDTETIYSQVQTVARDVTSGTEDGEMNLGVIRGGTFDPDCISIKGEDNLVELTLPVRLSGLSSLANNRILAIDSNGDLSVIQESGFSGTYTGDVTFTNSADGDALNIIGVTSEPSTTINLMGLGPSTDNLSFIDTYYNSSSIRGRLWCDRNGGNYIYRIGVGTNADDGNDLIVEDGGAGIRIGSVSNNRLTNALIGNLIDLSPLPTGDGTTQKSVLQTTGSAGSETYSWVDESEGGGNQFADQQALEDFITNKADFRSDIGAGTSDLVLGTTSTTALAGNTLASTQTVTGTWTFQNTGGNHAIFENSSVPRIALIKTGAISDGDTFTELQFGHHTSDDTEHIYGQIQTVGANVADAEEDGTLNLGVLINGTVDPDMVSIKGVENRVDINTDFYVSSGIRIGGTGSDNHLDDYEESTWTPQASGLVATDSSTDFATGTTGRYVKIGRLVHCDFRLRIPANTDTTSIGILPTSLPFAPLPGSSSEAGTSINGITSGHAADHTSAAPSTISTSSVSGHGSSSAIVITGTNFDYEDRSGGTVWGSFSYYTNS